jgi:hypothetical protein
MLPKETFRVALLWHGDRDARDTTQLETTRLWATAQALNAVGIETVPAIYHDDFASEVKAQLLGNNWIDGVLVWVNPTEKGGNRIVLDTMLREVAEAGVFVSSHPDTILKIGTKEVLYATRNMDWGGDIHLYASMSELREQLPLRFGEGKPRVLKQYRGDNGNGVWKVEKHPTDDTLLRVRHALRSSVEQEMMMEAFYETCEIYFANSGKLIDQPYQERLTEGIVRCYLSRNKVVGFGHQAINALFPAPEGAPATDSPTPSPRLYYPPDSTEFAMFGAIKSKMEGEWIAALCKTVGLDTANLPIIWDIDLLLGAKDASGNDTYVLCEINVSSVYPFPDAALEPLAQTLKSILPSAKERL